MLLALCSARHPCRFDMTMFEFFDPLGTQRPKVPSLGHDPGNRIKIPSDMFCIFHLLEHTKFGIKIFEIDMTTKI